MSTLTTNYLTPTGREEAWRFTPLAQLGGLLDPATSTSEAASLQLAYPVAGVTIETLSKADAPEASDSNDALVQRVQASVDQVTVLSIGANVECTDPVILNRVGGVGGVELGRTIIRTGAHSKATVLVQNAGSVVLGEDIELMLGDGSQLTFISLQEWDSTTVHVGRQHATIGRDASLTSFVVTVGGSVVRLLPTVDFKAPGASAELNGLYFATDGQHLEHRIHVDHNVNNAKSRVNYKGALSGDGARTVWIGDVYIHAGAEGTDTYELNRNLLLSDGARADSVPNLEIETGEIVGAGHASTTGRFDDEQLFYLQSRGIPADQARKLVIRGFFSEIIAKIGLPDVEDRLMSRIDASLEAAGV